MSSTLAKATILFLATFGAVATGGARAQSLDLPSDVRLVGFTVEPEGPEFGQVFDLRITVRIGYTFAGIINTAAAIKSAQVLSMLLGFL